MKISILTTTTRTSRTRGTGFLMKNRRTRKHTIFNSVNADTGEKYHSNARSYYSQIRAISDRLCREHGLSVIMEGKGEKAVSYIEWLRQSRGQPTFRSMLEADLRETIQDANDIGHFFLIMEHKGYEIKHGARLGFRLRGQERFMVPGRKNPLFTEDGIRAAIDGNLDEIAAGNRPAIIYRPRYEPYRRRQPQKYTGFMALYVHYLYLLGKAGQRQYPPKMTPHLRREIMKFESYKEQFAFLRAHGITTAEDLSAVRARAEETLASLMKQRTMVDVIMPSSEVERANLVFQKMMYQQPESPQKVQPERERQPEKEPGTPKKDSRSGRGLRDTDISSPTHARSAARMTSEDRPSVEGRLQDYRTQLEELRRRAPARQKTKTRTKTR
ncbi:relaxase/mobilization nuclease domain-containing protein [Ruthenibacterium lactatiformans]|uniref:relaxase/mobilization nuclease domain-containing protein n=1 Tax=Ruthenibacterium lactatiformans TaxID=1550024 RepID=UPI001FC86796|nr:relaxase/mobilization nuclease domain-containing protein [Ruthenibacterium lactatiformans]